jgi:hypothetical protein
MLWREDANSAQEGADFVTRNEQCCDQLGQPATTNMVNAVAGRSADLFRLRHYSVLAAARRAVLTLQLPRIAIDADPFAFLQNEARDRPVGVDRGLCNRMYDSQGQKPE